MSYDGVSRYSAINRVWAGLASADEILNGRKSIILQERRLRDSLQHEIQEENINVSYLERLVSEVKSIERWKNAYSLYDEHGKYNPCNKQCMEG